LGNALGEFRVQSHTSNLLNLVWFSDLKFLSVDAMEILRTSNPPHECQKPLRESPPGRENAGLFLSCKRPEIPTALAISLDHLGQQFPEMIFDSRVTLAGDFFDAFTIENFHPASRVTDQAARL